MTPAPPLSGEGITEWEGIGGGEKKVEEKRLEGREGKGKSRAGKGGKERGRGRRSPNKH